MLPPFAGTRELADYEAGSPELALHIANALVRDWCGWHIAPTVTETLVLNGPGTAVLMLPTLHLLDVHTVTENGHPVDLERVRWSGAGYLRRDIGWTDCEGGVRVGITHGWPDPPPVVAAVVLGIAKRAKDTPATAIRARTAGPFSETLTTHSDGSIGGITLAPTERDLLALYRIVPIA
ncbi:hypothetical protein IU494_30290 [Nocardia terpenica]|uniref:hypothetical protein n=1 Tax=Nocardia terpenica TaxID=455432 RepID=UPI001894C1D7|nr:hypothetical protein [Nocardia terpenica]MBF6064938.1 hypothetical protein [Nocardia terpenica]MBF6115210.1 hypothetical protein [Nocardia terpenica]MBF6122532.1 hypothetical protein [Nocardia terpenica]